ncbi:hypothetical protein [Tautonia marina]|uniref:hypothetical protein n=1 Tax=Tautonia marina TaxID=2653855 RepID=UPI001260D429|nr:hypothetical protein [Tautonia marina]
MRTLDDAWLWYEDTKKTLRRMERMGNRYWDRIPWDAPPWRGDRHFIDLTKEAIVRAAVNASVHLDDLAVVVLFSVFEANVRGAILDQMQAEEPQYQHRAIRDAIRAARDRIGEGSFYAVLSSFKGSDNNLIEDVNQVRKYRNWVSHGRRGAQPALVIPPVAFERLKKCMTLFFPPVPEEWVAISAYYVWEEETRPGARDSVYWNKGKTQLQEMMRTGELSLP